MYIVILSCSYAHTSDVILQLCIPQLLHGLVQALLDVEKTNDIDQTEQQQIIATKKHSY